MRRFALALAWALALVPTLAGQSAGPGNGISSAPSPGNSTAAALGADGVFPGEIIAAGQFRSASVVVETDAPGTLYIEYSMDGGNWHSQPFFVNRIGIEVPARSELNIAGSFFRVRFVNEATPQTFLRIQAFLSVAAAITDIHPAYGPRLVTNNTIKGEAAILAGQTTDIWGFAPSFIDWTKTGVVSVSSDSIQDGPAGTGADLVLAVGSSPLGEIVFEPIPLDGTTIVTSTKEFKSPLIGLSVIAVGAGGDEYSTAAAAGAITATIDGANAGLIKGPPTVLDGNGTNVAAIRLPFSFGQRLTSNLITVTAGVGTLSPGQGNVNVVVFIKQGTAPPKKITETIPFETGGAGGRVIQIAEPLASGEILFVRATTTKDVFFSVSITSQSYGPPPETCFSTPAESLLGICN